MLGRDPPGEAGRLELVHGHHHGRLVEADDVRELLLGASGAKRRERTACPRGETPTPSSAREISVVSV